MALQQVFQIPEAHGLVKKGATYQVTSAYLRRVHARHLLLPKWPLHVILGSICPQWTMPCTALPAALPEWLWSGVDSLFSSFVMYEGLESWYHDRLALGGSDLLPPLRGVSNHSLCKGTLWLGVVTGPLSVILKVKGVKGRVGVRREGEREKHLLILCPVPSPTLKYSQQPVFFSHLRRQKSACVIYEKDMTNSSVILGWFVIYQWQQCAAISNCGLSKSEHYKNKYNTCFWEELSVSEARSWL